MTSNEAYNLFDDLFLTIISNLPKPENLLDVRTYTSLINEMLQCHDRLYKAVKPKEDYAFNFFRDDNIYSIDKIKKSTYDVLNACILYNSSPTSYLDKCYLSVTNTLDIRFRNDKLKKI